MLILFAGLLDLVAGTGLAYVVGFGRVYATLTGVRWMWIAVVVAALCVSFGGYYLTYRGIYGPCGIPRRKLFAVVAAGFGGFFAHGGRTPDDLALEGAGTPRREAIVRVSALGGMEQGVLALAGCAASIAVLARHLTVPSDDATLPWAIIPLPAAAVVFWLAWRLSPKWRDRADWKGKLAVLGDSVLLTRELLIHPVRHRPALAGMAVFWAGETMAAWAAIAAFGYSMRGDTLVVGFCTGMVFTRRIAPLAGAGVLMLILPLAIWYCGAPFAVAVAGMFAYRALSWWLPMPVALACLPVLRALSEKTVQRRTGA